MALGCPMATSLARLGPESTPTFLQEVSSSRIWLMRMKESGSMPLMAWIRIWLPSSVSPRRAMVSRRAWDGTTTRITPHCSPREARSVVAVRPGCSSSSGRYFALRRVALIASAASGSRTQSVTGRSLEAARCASTVPQDPPPTTPTRGRPVASKTVMPEPPPRSAPRGRSPRGDSDRTRATSCRPPRSPRRCGKGAARRGTCRTSAGRWP
ncbi:hypothetical protein D3C87_794990 [compost metagenome]